MGNSPIYINGRFLSQRMTGVQKFAWAVTHELCKMHPEIVVVAPKNAAFKNVNFSVQTVGKRTGQAWEQIDLPLFLKNKKTPLLLNFCNTAPAFYKRQLITVHDVAFRVNPRWFNKKFARWYNFLIPKIIKNSLHIFTVSQFSKGEITKYYGTNADKITVVPNGIFFAEGELPAHEWPKSIPEKFILTVGSLNPRKQIDFLIRAFLKTETDAKLVVVGAENAVFAAQDFNENQRVVFLKNASDALVQKLYKSAQFSVSPSLYEGFGLPIFESLSAGCPVLASDLPVFKELYADEIQYFEAGKQSSLIAGLKKMNHLAADRSKIINVARILQKEMNYQKAAASIWQVAQKNS